MIGLDVASALKEKVNAASDSRAKIHWSGRPKYKELEAVCQIACLVKRSSSFGAFSAKQLTLYTWKLMNAKTMKEFFLWHSLSESSVGKDSILRFLRACEYGLPQVVAVMQIFAKQLNDHTDYSFLLGEMPRWFRAEVLKNLDEQGVPIQISERFYQDGDDLQTLSSRILKLASADDGYMTKFERTWVIDALS